MDVEKQIIILYATVNDFLSDIEVNKIRKFESGLLEHIDTHHRDLLELIIDKKTLTDEIKTLIEETIVEYKKIFMQEA